MIRKRTWEEAARLTNASAWMIAAGCAISLALSGAALYAGGIQAVWGTDCAIAAMRAVTMLTTAGLIWDLWQRRGEDT